MGGSRHARQLSARRYREMLRVPPRAPDHERQRTRSRGRIRRQQCHEGIRQPLSGHINLLRVAPAESPSSAPPPRRTRAPSTNTRTSYPFTFLPPADCVPHAQANTATIRPSEPRYWDVIREAMAILLVVTSTPESARHRLRHANASRTVRSFARTGRPRVRADRRDGNLCRPISRPSPRVAETGSRWMRRPWPDAETLAAVVAGVGATGGRGLELALWCDLASSRWPVRFLRLVASPRGRRTTACRA